MTTIKKLPVSAFDRLLSRFSAGAVPSDGYAVEPFDPLRGFLFLGCSEAGELAFVVASEGSHILPAPLRLAALSADFGVNCVLSDGTEEHLLRVSVLRCTASERSTGELFATMCGALSESLLRPPTEREFSELINRWSGLFWRLGQRVATDVVGLAGELMVIQHAHDIELWVEAWHAQPSDILDFDFIESPATVEVKTTRGSTREHPVSLAQVSGPGLENRFFASVQIDLNDSGELLADVVRGLSDRLAADTSRMMLWDVLTKTCGQGLDDVLSLRIDVEKAAKSLAFYRAEDIPVPMVEVPLPPGVSSLKFRSNMGLADEVLAAEVDAAIAEGLGGTKSQQSTAFSAH